MKDRSESKPLQGNTNLSRSWSKAMVAGKAKAGLPLSQPGIRLSPEEFTLPGRAIQGTLKPSFVLLIQQITFPYTQEILKHRITL